MREQKPSPPTIKTACIITLSRILLLSRSNPKLARELLSSHVPAFITACLNTVKSGSNGRFPDVFNTQLECILCSFYELLRELPSQFKPFAARIHAALLPLVAPTSPSSSLAAAAAAAADAANSNGSVPSETAAICPPQRICHKARQLLVRLHFCAPKGTMSGEWAACFRAVAQEFHATADAVFRCVIVRERSATHGARRPKEMAGSGRGSGSGGGGDGASKLDLPAWAGIFAGVERLTGLLRLLACFFSEPTACAIAAPVGAAAEALARVLALAAAAAAASTSAGQLVVETLTGAPAELHPEIARDERDALWAALPGLHVAALEALSALLDRLGKCFVSLAQGFLLLVVGVFECEMWRRYVGGGEGSEMMGIAFENEQGVFLTHLIFASVTFEQRFT